ncbi:MAG: FapA family protein [Desulfosarcinaceae bacterium]
MPQVRPIDRRFGEIALELDLLKQEKLNRALVIQNCIFSRTQVHMPIGKVLKEMGVLSQEQIDSVLEVQRNNDVRLDGGKAEGTGEAEKPPDPADALTLTVSKDGLGAYLSPNGDSFLGVTLDDIKALLEAHGVVYGLVSDDTLSEYLAKPDPPAEPFRIAYGKPPKEGHPPEIRYHFDTDPLRIGTVLEDGTMDWKNRGDVPEVKEGDLMAEKVGGDPGSPGTSVRGEEIAPPKVREPQIKCTKGAERSEDGRQVFAKVSGMPKLMSDGRITVMSVLPIEGDIGIETGHVDFDGYIEVNGGVCAGYRVTGRGLRCREIEKAEIQLAEDLVSYGGVYGSTVRVGGNIKASHIHNADLRITGDLEVDKEIIGSKVEVNGQVLMERGKIISSKITAKKGIQVHDVGTEASMPSELVVGVDRQFEREMLRCKQSMAEQVQQDAALAEAEESLKKQLDEIGTELGETAQLQDKFMVQRRRLDEKMVGPKAVTDEEERAMLADLLEELSQKEEEIEQKINDLMEQDDKLRAQLRECEQNQIAVREKTEALNLEMNQLEEALKADPGTPVAKINGTVYARTTIAGIHKKLKLSEEMTAVRIAESKVESGANAWQIKISNLR